MQQRENQRVAMSKRLLKEGLLRILETQELEKVNVSALCRESEINRATFYRHYTCPRDVLLDLEKDVVQQMGRNLKRPTSHQEAKAWLEEICTKLYENRDLIRILIKCKTDEDLAGILDEFSQRTWALRDEVSQLREMDQDSMRLMSTFLCTGSYYLLRQWLTEEMPKSPAEVAHLLYGIILIRPPMGETS